MSERKVSAKASLSRDRKQKDSGKVVQHRAGGGGVVVGRGKREMDGVRGGKEGMRVLIWRRRKCLGLCVDEGKREKNEGDVFEV